MNIFGRKNGHNGNSQVHTIASGASGENPQSKRFGSENAQRQPHQGAAAFAGKTAPKPQNTSPTSGTTIRRRGETRYTNFIWQAVAVIFLALLLIFKYQDHQTIKALAEKEGIVFEVGRTGETVIKDASEYHTAPLQVEISARSLNLAKWIIGAGSNNVETYYQEAQSIMTSGMRKDFEQLRGADHVQKLKELQIYRLLDGVSARPSKIEDLPADLQRAARLDRYYVTVSGNVNTYRMNSNQQLDGAPFAMLVKLVPAEKRTDQNPSGLLVEHIRDLDAVQVIKNNQPPKTAEEAKNGGSEEKQEKQNNPAEENPGSKGEK